MSNIYVCYSIRVGLHDVKTLLSSLSLALCASDHNMAFASTADLNTVRHQLSHHSRVCYPLPPPHRLHSRHLRPSQLSRQVQPAQVLPQNFFAKIWVDMQNMPRPAGLRCRSRPHTEAWPGTQRKGSGRLGPCLQWCFQNKRTPWGRH